MDSRKVSRPSLLVRALLLSDSLGQLSLDARLPAAAAEMAGAACPCSNPSRRPASPIAAAAVEMTGANHRETPAAASYPHCIAVKLAIIEVDRCPPALIEIVASPAMYSTAGIQKCCNALSSAGVEFRAQTPEDAHTATLKLLLCCTVA
uniref:Uncharacterized protein n=1 Tax=Oryza meridionalis TaxID=40149 RepID=A0A0E0C3H1_9ORYZ